MHVPTPECRDKPTKIDTRSAQLEPRAPALCLERTVGRIKRAEWCKNE